MKPLVIGHAAAAGEAPENTLAGVRQALDAGCEAMEIDLLLSADGVPVLMHDTTADRTTDLRGDIRDLPLARLKEADAGRGERVPTLAEVLELVDGSLTVLCELKATPGAPEWDERLVHEVLATVRAQRAEPWAAVHSFNAAIVAAARTAEPRVSAAIISGPVAGESLQRLLGATLKRGAQAISVEHPAVTRDLVLAAKRRQLCTWAWTADAPADWERLLVAGADGIITNVPHRLRAYLGA